MTDMVIWLSELQCCHRESVGRRRVRDSDDVGDLGNEIDGAGCIRVGGLGTLKYYRDAG